MSVTTLVAPELEEIVEPSTDAEHLSVPSDSELQKLNEHELKAAIKSAWKKYERLAKKEMGQLLYWLREKLRAQGTRNDIHDKDRGFGAWVEENLDISRRTADRWADWYAVENGLKESTSGQLTKSEDDEFYEQELRKHGKNIQFNYWVSQTVHSQYERSLKTIKKHFKIANDKEAVLRGVCYAAETIGARGRAGNRKRRTTAT